jgi:hypothetical protein
MVDIDGVLSLFGGAGPGVGAVALGATSNAARGSLHSIEGMPHFLSGSAAAHLLALGELYELVWASGWEERANEHLPHLLGTPAGLPFLSFERAANGGERPAQAHWKVSAIDAYAGARPLAWIDDALDDTCHAWAQARSAPTLLVQTEPQHGLTAREAQLLADWATQLDAR